MTGTSPLPVIAVCCCVREVGNGPAHTVRKRYLEALVETVGAMPLLVPAMGDAIKPERLFARIDGIMLTGSPSNIEPWNYGGGAPFDPHLVDPARDSTTLPLIRAAVAHGVPVFGICRGIQEINVALGGSLHQRVHALDGRFDHRSNKTLPMLERFCDVHDIRLEEGGLLQAITGCQDGFRVNSLHAQGIDRLAAPLRIEATAADGTIEAISLREPSGFLLGVQWHPEYRLAEHPFNRLLYAAFGEACRKFAAARRNDEPFR